MNLKGGGYKWSKMNLLLREAGFPLSHRVRSSVVREELGIQSLPVHMERSQLRLLGHLGTSLRRCLRQALPEGGLRQTNNTLVGPSFPVSLGTPLQQLDKRSETSLDVI